MSSSYRVPRAVQSGFDEHSEHEVIELHHNGLAEVLHSVRQTAAELLAQSPIPPSTLSVRAGTVAVELSFDPSATPVIAGEAVPAAPAAAAASAPAGEVIAASTVGVFYTSPSPGAPPFVKEGDQVTPGQQVGIIEAMKLMLPVEADRAGRIAETLVDDGTSVEFGQPLFRIVQLES
jgi:acetyl-CoA carboxylase biotin carboxyl carrier protein